MRKGFLAIPVTSKTLCLLRNTNNASVPKNIIIC